MTNFIWPSDIDRAENDELNRVCEHLEEVLDERDALAGHLEAIGEYMRDQWPGAYAKVFERFGNVDPAAYLDRLKAEWDEKELMKQARRVRNYSNPHDVFEAIPVAALEGELRRQAKGAAAYHAGLGISDNPYLSDASPQPTEAAHAWQRGYEVAAREAGLAELEELRRLKAQWQEEVLDRLRELLEETHMAKAPTVARAAMHVDDSINRVKQECKPLELRRQAEEHPHD